MDLIDRKKLLEAIDENIRISDRASDRDVIESSIFQMLGIVYNQPSVYIADESKGKHSIDLKTIAEHYKYESQSKMLIEEMAELTKEISKHWRRKDNILSIIEEIADVEIMLAQIKYLLDIEEPVEDWKKVKIARQLKRMEEE